MREQVEVLVQPHACVEEGLAVVVTEGGRDRLANAATFEFAETFGDVEARGAATVSAWSDQRDVGVTPPRNHPQSGEGGGVGPGTGQAVAVRGRIEVVHQGPRLCASSSPRSHGSRSGLDH